MTIRRWVGVFRTSSGSHAAASWTQDRKPDADPGTVVFGYGPVDAFDIVESERDLIKAMEVIDLAVLGNKIGFGTVEWTEYVKWLAARGRSPISSSHSLLPGPRKPKPQLPPEVWNAEPIDAEAAMKAMRDMCKGS